MKTLKEERSHSDSCLLFCAFNQIWQAWQFADVSNSLKKKEIGFFLIAGPVDVPWGFLGVPGLACTEHHALWNRRVTLSERFTAPVFRHTGDDRVPSQASFITENNWSGHYGVDVSKPLILAVIMHRSTDKPSCCHSSCWARLEGPESGELWPPNTSSSTTSCACVIHSGGW